MEETKPAAVAAEEEVKWFECQNCKLKEVYDSKTKKPKFGYLSFNDYTYIVKDPFSPPENKQILILGSDCCLCNKPVCQSNDCSIFFKHRYCQQCAWKNKNHLPEQLQSKIKKPNSS